jgi:hypothetical protein
MVQWRSEHGPKRKAYSGENRRKERRRGIRGKCRVKSVTELVTLHHFIVDAAVATAAAAVTGAHACHY